ncbi:hypothetical protein GCM10009676_28310 [Prauserella halophila]|uniref:PPE domain-containing protein n=1 Tax=Prauserella halophila TaxID=185641 RepID=A0ABP4GXF0_9PSEU|nr:PPE domain-containing protein [Prauserella halophila]MCP2236892.1 PPE family protein [Prauserella halophila]
MAMDVSQRANEIRNHRFDGYTDEMLAREVEVFRSGAGTGGIGEAVSALKSVGKALHETERTLRTELGKLGVEWHGDASDQAFRWLTGQADFSEEAQSTVEACAKKIFAQGEAFNRTVHRLPDAASLRQDTGGYGVMDSLGSLLGFETDNARRVAQGQEARAQALEALNGYASESGANLSELPQLSAPAPMSAAVTAEVPTEVDAGGPPKPPDVTEVPASAPADDRTESSGVTPPAARPVDAPVAPGPVHHTPQPAQQPVNHNAPLAPPPAAGSATQTPSTAPSSTTPATAAPVSASPNGGHGYVNVPRPGSGSQAPQYSGSQYPASQYPASQYSASQYSGSQYPASQYPGGAAQPGGPTGAAPANPAAPTAGGTPGAVGKPATPGTPPGTPAVPGGQGGQGAPATPGQPGGQSGAGKLPSAGGGSSVTPAPGGPATGSPAPGGGATVPPPGMVGGKAGAPASGDAELQKGKSFGVAPVAGGTAVPTGGTTASPKSSGFGVNDVGGATGAVAAGGIAGALAGDSERSGGRGGVPRSPHQSQIGDLPEEQSRAQQNQTPKSEQDRRGMMQKAAPQEGDEDDAHVRRYGVDDNDLFADQRMVSPGTIGDPNAEQR